MADRVAWNGPCTCGSDKKYKQCCGRSEYLAEKQGRNRVILVCAAAIGVVAFLAYSSREDTAPSFVTPPNEGGYVWSDEHNHFHIPEDERHGGELVPQPEGEAPPGKAWSEEHGHWHDDINNPPPGMVWSDEHKHWHNLDGSAAEH